MVFGEEFPCLTGIAFEAFTGGVFRSLGESEVVDRIVSLFAGTFTSPSFSGVMMSPKRVVHRQSQLLAPERLVYRVRSGGGSWHPS